MTAPTTDQYDDEARLRHFLRVQPVHTGLHLSPTQITQGVHKHWWFADEASVERYEIAHRRLFCRACAKDHDYAPLLVDFQPDPLGAHAALCTTHCYHCDNGEMYPVEKLTWEIGDELVRLRLFKLPRQPTAEEIQQQLMMLRIGGQHNAQAQNNLSALGNLYGGFGIGQQNQNSYGAAQNAQAQGIVSGLLGLPPPYMP